MYCYICSSRNYVFDKLHRADRIPGRYLLACRYFFRTSRVLYPNMKNYSRPQLTCFGDITELTGYFGPSGVDDVFIDHEGNDISDEDDTGSTDACASADLSDCL